MNERIDKIYQKSFSTYQVGVGFADARFVERFDLRKFAELIVKECINVSEAHAKSLESQPSDPLLEEYEDGIVNGIYEATTAIKEHFGVEE